MLNSIINFCEKVENILIPSFIIFILLLSILTFINNVIYEKKSILIKRIIILLILSIICGIFVNIVIAHLVFLGITMTGYIYRINKNTS